VVLMLVIAVCLPIWALLRSDAAQSSFTSDWQLAIAVPP
jgi:hypothetical protein